MGHAAPKHPKPSRAIADRRRLRVRVSRARRAARLAADNVINQVAWAEDVDTYGAVDAALDVFARAMLAEREKAAKETKP